MAETKRTGGGHGRNHGYQRPKDMKGTFKKLMGYVGKYKGSLVLVAICLLISSAAGVATSYLLKPLLNDYIIPGDFPGLFKMLLVMGGMYLLSSLCSFAYARIMVHVAQHTVAALRQDLFNRLQQLPVSYYDRHQSGDLMSRFTNDIDTVSEMLNSSFASIISNVLTFVGTVVMMIVLNPWLTLITFLFLGLMGLVVKVIGGRSRANFQRQQAALGALNGYIEEMIEGQKVIKVFNHEGQAVERFTALNGDYRDAATAAQAYAGMMMPAMGNLSKINYAVTCCVGGLLAIGGVFDIGSLGAYLLYVKQVSQPVGQISQQINTLLAAAAGAERIFAVMDEQPETDEGKTVIVSGSGNVATYAIEKAWQLGAKPVTCSDSTGWIYDPDGIDVATLIDVKQVRRARLTEYAKARPNSVYHEGKGVWTVKCDVALPCATQNELLLDDAKTLVANGCFAVAEGANMPTSLDATAYLQEHGILFCPGKASNAGGVATSALEMTQNSERLSWTFEEVDAKLKTIMVNIFHNLDNAAKEYGMEGNYVAGANIAGFLKVADAMTAQGIV